MRKTEAMLALFAAVSIFCRPLLAQEKPKVENAAKQDARPILLKIQVVFEEFGRRRRRPKVCRIQALLSAWFGQC